MLHLITTRKTNILSTVLVCGLLLMGAALQYGGIKHDLVNVVTSSGSLVLTNTSTQVVRLTGSTAQTVKLPDAATSRVGWWYIVSNDSTQTATVTNGADQPIGTIAAGNSATFYLTSASTLGGPWDLQPGNGSSGGGGGGGGSFWTGLFTVATGDFQTNSAYPTPVDFNDNAFTMTEVFNPDSWTVAKFGDKPGIVITAPSTGYIETCFSTGFNFNTTNAYGTVDVYDGTNSASLVTIGNTGIGYFPYRGCIVTQVTASSNYTIRLRGSVSAGVIQINGGLDTMTYITARYL